MKIKRPVFRSRNDLLAQWYAIINGDFYVWSESLKCWLQSINEPDDNAIQLQAAMDEGRVYMVQLRGRIDLLE